MYILERIHGIVNVLNILYFAWPILCATFVKHFAWDPDHSCQARPLKITLQFTDTTEMRSTFAVCRTPEDECHHHMLLTRSQLMIRKSFVVFDSWILMRPQMSDSLVGCSLVFSRWGSVKGEWETSEGHKNRINRCSRLWIKHMAGWWPACLISEHSLVFFNKA